MSALLPLRGVHWCEGAAWRGDWNPRHRPSGRFLVQTKTSHSHQWPRGRACDRLVQRLPLLVWFGVGWVRIRVFLECLECHSRRQQAVRAALPGLYSLTTAHVVPKYRTMAGKSMERPHIILLSLKHPAEVQARLFKWASAEFAVHVEPLEGRKSSHEMHQSRQTSEKQCECAFRPCLGRVECGKSGTMFDSSTEGIPKSAHIDAKPGSATLKSRRWGGGS